MSSNASDVKHSAEAEVEPKPIAVRLSFSGRPTEPPAATGEAPQPGESEAPQSAEGMFLLTTKIGQRPVHKVLLDNWQPAVTVALVSVPLSISLGIASVGTDDPAAPTMGVATAFWGGLCAGVFGSSDMNIVGPAGALSGMLSAYTIQFNGAGVLPYISIISACIVFVIWALNLQGYMLLMPKAVFEGFTLAVALIIGLNQMNMAFDLHPPGPKHEHFYENVVESVKVLDELSVAPTVFFFVCAALLLGLVKWLPKVKGFPIPWTVIIPCLTMIVGYLSNEDMLGGIEIPTLKDKYGELKAHVFEPPSKPLSHYAQGKMGGVISAAFGVAFVAVLETLISAKIAQQKTNWGFDDSRETLGLMIAHAVCGAAGALPPTGVFVRTALNFSLGCTHKLSQIMNAFVVLLISVVAVSLKKNLPQASIAALLIFASVRMAPITYMIELWQTDKGSLALLVLTTLICVFSDPVYGLIVGMVIALLRDARYTTLAESRLSVHELGATVVDQDARPALCTMDVDTCEETLAQRKAPVKTLMNVVGGRLQGKDKASEGKPEENVNVLNDVPSRVSLYEPIGPLVFLSADKHEARIKAFAARRPAAIVVSLEMVTRVDKDGSDSLGKNVKQIIESKTPVCLALPPSLKDTIVGRSAWVKALQEKQCVFESRAEAMRSALESKV